MLRTPSAPPPPCSPRPRWGRTKDLVLTGCPTSCRGCGRRSARRRTIRALRRTLGGSRSALRIRRRCLDSSDRPCPDPYGPFGVSLLNRACPRLPLADAQAAEQQLYVGGLPLYDDRSSTL